MNYWLHRISHEWEMSYFLLENGYLSLGWSAFSGTDILNDARKDDGYESFEKTYGKIREKKERSRWNMWYLAQFKKDDIIVVPLFGSKFAICKVLKQAESICSIKYKFPEFSDENGRSVKWNDTAGLYKREDETQCIDLGFVVPVEILANNVPRKDYADGSLTSRMKMRQTNGDISDIGSSVEKALDSFQNNKPVNFYESVLEAASGAILGNIRNVMNSDKFEILVKKYMEAIGAYNVAILPKNQHGKRDFADADVVATFDKLKVTILIQVKWHNGSTDAWPVQQITKYTEQLNDENSQLSLDNDFGDIYIPWVISSCNSFDDEAVKLAAERGVRLIDGMEFARMLLDAGLSNIKID